MSAFFENAALAVKASALFVGAACLFGIGMGVLAIAWKFCDSILSAPIPPAKEKDPQ